MNGKGGKYTDDCGGICGDCVGVADVVILAVDDAKLLGGLGIDGKNCSCPPFGNIVPGAFVPGIFGDSRIERKKSIK